jgi:hypothetical protein
MKEIKQNDWNKATEAIENLAILVNGEDEDLNILFQLILKRVRRLGNQGSERQWIRINEWLKIELGVRLPPRGKESKSHIPGKVERRGCPKEPCSRSRHHCSNCGLHGVQFSAHEGEPDCYPRILGEEE